MTLSPSELQHFQDEGYVVKPQVFTEKDLQPLRRAIGNIVAEEAARLQATGLLPATFASEPFERRLGRIMAAYPEAGMAIYRAIMGQKGGGGFTGPEMFSMIVHSPLLSCVESIVGPDIVASSVYRIRPKMPGFTVGEVPWHQDSAYMEAHCDRFMIVTCWIPLVDATLQNGCLWVQPRVHRRGIVRHHSVEGSNYLVIADPDLPGRDEVPVEMQAGDVLFLTNATPHCSRENTSDIVRWSIDLRYQSMAVPTNAEQPPEEYLPDNEPLMRACYPPEADFVVRSRAHPGREVRTAEDFHHLRRRYEEAEYIRYPQRGWQPLAAPQE